MARTNRLVALRLIRAYKTVSGDAATFQAGSIPLDLLALERSQLLSSKREGLSDEDYASRARKIKQRTLTQ